MSQEIGATETDVVQTDITERMIAELLNETPDDAEPAAVQDDTAVTQAAQSEIPDADQLAEQKFREAGLMPPVDADMAITCIRRVLELAESWHEVPVRVESISVEVLIDRPHARVWTTLSSGEKFYTDVRPPHDDLFARLRELHQSRVARGDGP